MSKTPHPMSSGGTQSDYFFYVCILLSAAFLHFPFATSLFPVFLPGLSQGTPTPTLQPCHREDGKALENTRKP